MIDGLKPYPAYKDSGVEWLGEVPAHWEVRRLRNLAEMRAGNVDKHSKEGELPVRLCNYVDVYKNDYIRSSMRFMQATATQDEVDRFRLAVGDVLITKDSEAWNDIGVPALVREAASNLLCGYHLALLRPFEQRLSGEYLLRALQSTAAKYQFHVEAKGVTRYGLSHAAIKSVSLPVPPLPEQAAMVRFLDYVDRRVRRVIRARERLVKLLEEYKQALIRQAVTGRIDVRTGRPYPEYKDSGVQWLGKVPEHWEIRRLKTVARIQGGYAFPSEAFCDVGVPVIRMNNLRRGRLDFTQIVRIPRDLCKDAFALEANDILYGLSGSIGATGSLGNYAVVNSEDVPAQLNQRVARLKPREGQLTNAFLLQLLTTPEFYAQVLIKTTGTAQFNVSTNDLAMVVLPVPPIDEQKRLTQYLDKQTASIDRAADAARHEIELLREYRERLIADVVTGKVDVREAAAGLPEESDESEPLEDMEADNEADDSSFDDANAVPEKYAR